jgi:molybdopterin molybdotransferase
MVMRYSEALGILKQVAVECVERGEGRDIEYVGYEDAVGRIAGQDHLSPIATPPFDISGVEGYAISSVATAKASKKKPITFVVKGTIAVGDEPPEVPPQSGNGIPSCFEMMAGARFPENTSAEVLDACVKLEDVVPTVFGTQKMITVVESIPKNANRRPAGSDLESGHKILAKGETIQSRHIMALASAGFQSVAVGRKLKVAIYSTGNGVTRNGSQAMDANGLFLTAALRELEVGAEFLGVLGGDVDKLSGALSHQIERGEYDAIVTTGALSKGQSNFVLSALNKLNARIRFHGVSIRPGHPVLFATLPAVHGDVPFFGLPGDAVATAACFRFLVVPFVRQLSGLSNDVPKILRIQQNSGFQDLSKSCPPQSDCFRHGWVQRNERGEEVVTLSADQSPGKVSHYTASNCWVHVPRGHSGNCRDTLVYCYAHAPGTSA